MLLTGKFYVRCKYFGNGKDIYPVLSTSVSNTNLKGEKTTSFLNVYLSNSAKDKAEDLDILKYDEETNVIEVTEGWLTPNSKGGVNIFINDFDFEEDEKMKNDSIYPDDEVPKRKTTSKQASKTTKQAPKRTTTKQVPKRK